MIHEWATGAGTDEILGLLNRAVIAWIQIQCVGAGVGFVVGGIQARRDGLDLENGLRLALLRARDMLELASVAGIVGGAIGVVKAMW